jgi:hypothetical protein
MPHFSALTSHRERLLTPLLDKYTASHGMPFPKRLKEMLDLQANLVRYNLEVRLLFWYEEMFDYLAEKELEKILEEQRYKLKMAKQQLDRLSYYDQLQTAISDLKHVETMLESQHDSEFARTSYTIIRRNFDYLMGVQYRAKKEADALFAQFTSA